MRRFLLPLTDGPPTYLAMRLEDHEARSPCTPTSVYAELNWLPAIGPTSLWVARRIEALCSQYRALVVETGSFAAAMGVRPPILCKSLDRLVVFHVAQWDSLDQSCPILSMHAQWPEAPAQALAHAYQLRPIQERNNDGGPGHIAR